MNPYPTYHFLFPYCACDYMDLTIGCKSIQGLSDLSQRTAELKTLDSTIVAKTAALYHQACVWMASMDSDFHPMTNQSQQRRMQFKFIRQVEYFSDLCLPDFSFGEDAQVRCKL